MHVLDSLNHSSAISAGRAQPVRTIRKRKSPTLSTRELRRIIAEMIG
jgi:hypothetical protein